MSAPFDPAARALPHVRDLHAYVPGEQPTEGGWTKLNTNENPYLPSPRVAEAVTDAVERLRLYPEPTGRRLREALGDAFGLASANVIVGNGSDNLLDLITRAFGGAGGAGYCVPSYSLYPVVAGMSGTPVREVPFDRSMTLDSDAIAACGASVFFLTSPNAPTGVAFAPAVIEELLARLDGFLVVDEAYADFGAESVASLVARHRNLIVVRTFSKSHALAGLRVGYALADPETVRVLDRVRDAYNVDTLAQAGALAALEDREYFERRRDQIVATRESVRATLEGWGWFTYPSRANFLFTEPRNAGGRSGPEVAEDLFAHLKRSRILVRYFPGHPLTCAFLRVTVGTDAEMARFTDAARSWLNNANA